MALYLQPKFKPGTAGLAALIVLALGLGLYFFFFSAYLSKGTPVTVKLRRGDFTVFDFPSQKAAPTALLIFASGDGGWGSLEESIAHAFQAKGYEVIGVDSELYAQTDYDLDILQSDFSTIAASFHSDRQRTPLIIGGYSMGAAQAIAATGGPHPPPGQVGLLLVDPCSRGRYGLRRSDQLNILPTGPGTFGVNSFSGGISSVRVVQWHADEDTIDSLTWLDSLPAPHRAFTFLHTGHVYENDRGTFIHRLVASADWLWATPEPTR